jgi:hypothetical protein
METRFDMPRSYIDMSLRRYRSISAKSSLLVKHAVSWYFSADTDICLKNHHSRRRDQALRGQGNLDRKVTSGSLALAIKGTILVVNVPLVASTHVAAGDKIANLRMPAFFYTVALGINKSSPKKGWLVELLCTQHKQSPEMSACDVAESAVKRKFGPQAIIGYRDSTEYSSPLPMNLGGAYFTAPCGCRAWPLPF